MLIVRTLTVLVSCQATREIAIDRGTDHSDSLEQLVNACYREFQDITWRTRGEFEKRRDTEMWVILDTRSVIERAISVIPGALSKIKRLNRK